MQTTSRFLTAVSISTLIYILPIYNENLKNGEESSGPPAVPLFVSRSESGRNSLKSEPSILILLQLQIHNN